MTNKIVGFLVGIYVYLTTDPENDRVLNFIGDFKQLVRDFLTGGTEEPP